jgi:hypothetical protein
MKKILLLTIAVLSSFTFFAQNAAETTTAKLKETYRLTDAQVKKMEQIQQNRLKNLSEVEKYKTTNPTMYLRKRQSISTGTNGSIERLLNKEQMVTYRQKQAEIRIARAKKETELKSSKTGDLEKQMILLELEDQF